MYTSGTVVPDVYQRLGSRRRGADEGWAKMLHAIIKKLDCALCFQAFREHTAVLADAYAISSPSIHRGRG